MQARLQELRSLRGTFKDYIQSQPTDLALGIQENYNRAMEEVFVDLHQQHAESTAAAERTRGGINGAAPGLMCSCGGTDDTRGLGEGNDTYSLNEFLLDVVVQGQGEKTSGLLDQQQVTVVSEEYKRNLLEFERQDALLKQFHDALSFHSSVAPTAAAVQ